MAKNRTRTKTERVVNRAKSANAETKISIETESKGLVEPSR